MDKDVSDIELAVLMANESKGNIIDKHTFPDKDIYKNGEIKLLSTFANFAFLMEKKCIAFKYNLMTRQIEITIPGIKKKLEDGLNIDFANIESICIKNEFSITESRLKRYIVNLAHEKPYHPIRDLIKAKPWDKTPRLDEFVKTIPVATEKEEFSKTLIKTWMTAVMAAAFSDKGFSSHGVLVLRGDQNIGKTAWINSLFNFYPSAVKIGEIFDPRIKDDVLRVAKYLVVELGELDGTFKKSDIAALKSYLTNDMDDIRRPYGMYDSQIPRRTVFAASVNELQFLADTTGNRRWWTLEVVAPIDYQHKFDMQQVWAEVYDGLLNGHKTYLSGEQLIQLNIINDEHTPVDSIEQKINTDLHWDNMAREFCTVTQVAQKIGIDNPGRGELIRVAKALRDRGLITYAKKIKGKTIRGFDVP